MSTGTSLAASDVRRQRRRGSRRPPEGPRVSFVRRRTELGGSGRPLSVRLLCSVAGGPDTSHSVCQADGLFVLTSERCAMNVFPAHPSGDFSGIGGNASHFQSKKCRRARSSKSRVVYSPGGPGTSYKSDLWKTCRRYDPLHGPGHPEPRVDRRGSRPATS